MEEFGQITFPRQIGGDKKGRLIKSGMSKTFTGRGNSIPSRFKSNF